MKKVSAAWETSRLPGCVPQGVSFLVGTPVCELWPLVHFSRLKNSTVLEKQGDWPYRD